MLPIHEERLISAEDKLPSMRQVLDPECVSEWIGSEAERIYVRYRPGAAAVATYRVLGTLLTVETMSDSKKLHDKSQGTWRAGALGIGMRLDNGVAYWEYPNDRELPHAVHNMDRPLSYKPFRRLVVQAQEGETKFVRKFHTRGDYSRLKDIVKSIKPRGPLTLQKRLAKDRTSRSIAYEWIDGQPLGETPSELTLRRVGAALAKLHSGKSERLRCQTRDDECAALQAAAMFSANILPQCAQRIRTLANELSETLRKRDFEPGPIHGDLKASQIIIGSEVGFIDFDRAAIGDPAYDVGSLLARTSGDALLANYFDAFREIPNVALQTACALVRSLPDPYKSGSLSWPEETFTILERAEKTLIDTALPEIEDALRSPTAQIIRHKPGRRAVVATDGTITKLRAKGLDVRAAKVYEELEKRSLPFNTPRVVGYASHLRAITFERLHGHDAERRIFAGDIRSCELAGKALAELHNATIRVERVHSIQDELEILEKKLMGDHHLLELCRQASKQLHLVQHVAIHRDFHPGQLLSNKNGIAILDFDLMSMGDPAIDVGNFTAHLDEATIRGEHVSPLAAEVFIEAYQNAAGPALYNNIAIDHALSLARLVAIASEKPERRAWATELRAAALLKLKELQP